MESASYPEDEAATYEKLKYRIEHASNVFMAALQPGSSASEAEGTEPQPDQLVGFVCGTQTSAGKLTHESMSTHDPEGSLLCIHSVVVAHALRRQGIATRMLKAYLQYIQATTPSLQGVRLLCKEDLVSLWRGRRGGRRGGGVARQPPVACTAHPHML